MKITVFLGAPGSGKGTQAKRLAEATGCKHFSTGDMLRAALAAQSPVGLKAKQYMDKGELVPDVVMIELIEDSLAQLGGNATILLDGFPRTLPQAKALDSNPRTQVSRAIYFKIPEEVLVARLTGRRSCPKCGESYHTQFIPPKQNGVCDKCSTTLTQRADDKEEVVRKRLQVFSSSNTALLDYYKSKDNLREINADHDVALVQTDLIKML